MKKATAVVERSVAEDYQNTKRRAAYKRNRRLQDRHDSDIRISPIVKAQTVEEDPYSDIDLKRITRYADLPAELRDF